MPLFDYQGFNAAGKKISGTIEAGGKKAALSRLRSQGIYPSSLHEEEEGGPERRLPLQVSLRQNVPVIELAGATRQLATLLGAGLPLDEAFSIVGAQLEHPVLARAMGRVRDEVIQGESLHGALARQGKIFPPLYVNMVQVGENSGTLDKVLKRLADFLEEQAMLRSRIRSAMAYPLLMGIIGTGVLFFLMTYVVPKVTGMLSDLGQALPLPTLLLISFSDFLGRWWWVLLAALAAAVIALLRYRRSEAGRLALDRLLLSLPIVGRLNLLIATSRFTRTLGILLQNGVPLLSALDISKGLMENRVLHDALAETAVCVREGEGLAEPLRRMAVFPPMVPQMAAVGEKSGELEEMLFRIADTYDHQVTMSIEGMLSLLEPLMILAMGVTVGFIVIAILLPIFQASQGMG